MRLAAIVVLCALLAACAAAEKRPVLYPNDRLRQVGDAQARRDVDGCIARAENAGAQGRSASPAARGAVQGAAVGGATAGVASAIRGGRVLERAAEGAAVGATAGAVHGAFRERGPDALHRNFVRRCLAELGYEVIGWR